MISIHNKAQGELDWRRRGQSRQQWGERKDKHPRIRNEAHVLFEIGNKVAENEVLKLNGTVHREHQD